MLAKELAGDDDNNDGGGEGGIFANGEEKERRRDDDGLDREDGRMMLRGRLRERGEHPHPEAERAEKEHGPAPPKFAATSAGTMFQ